MMQLGKSVAVGGTEILAIAALGIAALWVYNQRAQADQPGGPGNPLPPDTSYINPLICALTGKFCPPEPEPAPAPYTDPCCCPPNNWGNGPAWDCTPPGGWSGDYDEQPNGWWCKRACN